MSLAIAEAIMARDEWTPRRLAARFVAVYKRGPRPGYTREFQKFLDEVRDGEEFLRRINPKSDESGAVMRAASIGIFAEVSEVILRSSIQSKITRDTPDGIAAGVAAPPKMFSVLISRRRKAFRVETPEYRALVLANSGVDL